jgi:hypothetical protein
MNHYETPVPKVIAENHKYLKFRRRILSPRTNAPRPYTRVLRLISHGLAITASVYIVLFWEFPPGHCFTGIRDWYAIRRQEFLTLSEEEKLGKIQSLKLEYGLASEKSDRD